MELGPARPRKRGASMKHENRNFGCTVVIVTRMAQQQQQQHWVNMEPPARNLRLIAKWTGRQRDGGSWIETSTGAEVIEISRNQ